MKYVFAVFGVLVLAVLLLAGMAVAALFDTAPAIADPPPLTASDLETVQGLLRQVDPRTKVAGSLTELTLRESDIEQTLNYGLDRFRRRGSRRGSMPMWRWCKRAVACGCSNCGSAVSICRRSWATAS